MPLDGQARGIVTQARYALLMMHRGAALPRCDWAIGWEDEGFGNRLPHLDGARSLSALACLRARLRFEDGQGGEAVEDVFAALAMGRHASRDGSLPAVLAGYAIERRMSETLALYLPRLDARATKDLKRRLAALPPGGTLATGVREEQILETGWFVRKVKEAKDGESLLALLSQVWGRDEGRAVARGLWGHGGRRNQITRRSCSRGIRRWPGRWTSGRIGSRRSRTARRRSWRANPLYKKLVPAILRCRWLQAQADVRRGLLSAAIDVQLDGRECIEGPSRPRGRRAVRYVAFEGGFELRSRWVPDATLREAEPGSGAAGAHRGPYWKMIHRDVRSGRPSSGWCRVPGFGGPEGTQSWVAGTSHVA